MTYNLHMVTSQQVLEPKLIRKKALQTIKGNIDLVNFDLFYAYFYSKKKEPELFYSNFPVFNTSLK